MIVVIVMILTEEGIAVEIVLEDLLLVIGIDEDLAQAIVATDTQVAAVAVAVAEETEIAIEEETTETAEAAREINSLMLLRIETRDSTRPIEPSNQPHRMNLITLCPISLHRSPQCHSPYIVFSLEFDSSLPCGVFAVCFCFLSLSASSLFLLKDPIFVSRFQRFLFFSLRSVDRHRRRGRGQRNRDRRGWSRE
jgi:hypothetical protein